jgi:branched-subunit amino acid aminotransferase/4-amino-4-deoxychorismate lyase
VHVHHAVCLNGELIAPEAARVSVFDAAFQQGIGLFETMRAYGGRVFRMQRHLDRLRQSAMALGWTVLPEVDELRDHVRQVLDATAGIGARVRLTVTPGSLHPGQSEAPPLTVLATASSGDGYPDEYYTKGVTLAVSDWRQSDGDPLAGHKTTSYFARLASLRLAHTRGAFEVLWTTPDGRVAEGAISNIFAVEDGVLLTPPLDTPVLPGITRATVLELAGAIDVPVREEDISIEQLRAVDELFLTNSMMEIMPVVRIERETVGTEKPGEVTREIATAFHDLIMEECGDGDAPGE